MRTVRGHDKPFIVEGVLYRYPASEVTVLTYAVAGDWWLLVPSDNVDVVRFSLGLEF